MADNLAYHNPDLEIDVEEDLEESEFTEQDVINVLDGYANEAENARSGGPNPRDDIWKANWDRYWGRYNNSGKAAWQSTHVMPEVPVFVDRFASALREALDRFTDWFTVTDASGKPGALTVHIGKTLKVILSRCARTPDGQVADFSAIFEDQMKLGAIMACCSSVTWEHDIDAPDGWARVSTVDPREVWYDAKGRGLYRRRKYEIDQYELLNIAREADDDGDMIYDIDVIMDLMSEEDIDVRQNRERSSGGGQDLIEGSGRKPITMEEWLCTIIMQDGTVIAQNALVVVANGKFIIRGPEINPFDHKRDWIIFAPMISVPLSIYGRTYMEDWSDVADAFVELTNLILDGTYTSTMKAFVANPDLLDDPTQLAEGISPNKIFEVSEDIDTLKRFIAEIDLGTLPAESIKVWQALKVELREGAKLSEIALGQLAPNSRTTAEEIATVSQSGSASIRSIARTIETRWVEPTLDRVWKTALQHMDFMTIADIIGIEVAQMFNERRDEFLESSFQIRVRGISGIIDRQQRLQNLMTALSVIGSNEFLARELFSQLSPARLIDTLFALFNIDKEELVITERERLIQQLTQQQAQQQAQQGQQGAQNASGQDLIQ